MNINRSPALWRNIAYTVATVLAVCLVVAVFFHPSAVAAGWLIGFLFWSQILIGSLSLLMIHRLTSGRWGEIIASATIPTAATMPALLLLVVPLFVSIALIYPWSRQPGGIESDVRALYLNMPFFMMRSVLALCGWTVLSIILPRSIGRRGTMVAALGLIFHAVAISGVSIDWYLSEAAPFTSSSFGASMAITQLIAGLSWALVLGPEYDGDRVSDLGALLLAFLLALTYIDFMAVLVIWYGDLPREEAWFVARSPWLPLGLGAFFLVSVIPIFLLLAARVRRSRRALRCLGTTVLTGLALYDAYLTAPGFGAAVLFWAFLSIATIGFALFGWLTRPAQNPIIRMRARHAA